MALTEMAYERFSNTALPAEVVFLTIDEACDIARISRSRYHRSEPKLDLLPAQTSLPDAPG
jgi:hypothetical protein